jgi:hypothetical protein
VLLPVKVELRDRARPSRELSLWILKTLWIWPWEPMEISQWEEPEQEMAETALLLVVPTIVEVVAVLLKSSMWPARTSSLLEQVEALDTPLLEAMLD